MDILLTKLQRDIVIGTILGDGCIALRYDDGILKIKQSEQHKEYVFWLYEKLRNLCVSFPKQRKDNNQWYFDTRSIQEFTNFRHLFYPDGKKIIPKNISNLLISPLSLAVWYMDDGTLDYRPKDHFAFYLATHSFSVGDTGSGAYQCKGTVGLFQGKPFILRDT